MREQPHYLDILTVDFFDEYYNKKKMSFPKIHKRLLEQGQNIAISTLHNYAKKLGFGRGSSEARRNNDPDSLDYNISYLSPVIIEAIDGFLLGDGSIMTDKRVRTEVARFTCSVEYMEFCQYMMSFFAKYDSNSKTYQSKRMNQGFICQGKTRFHPDIYKQYLRWYPLSPNGKRIKQPPDDVRVTPLSVMIWYLGDGTAVQSRHSVSIRLSTDSFLAERVELLVNKLQKESIDCHRNNDNRIRIDVKGIPAFFGFIGQVSPVKCYDYKFDLPSWRFSAKRMRQVANELNVDYHHLSYLVKIGRVPCLRTSEGGRPRFLPEHIETIKQYFHSELTKTERTTQTNLEKYGVENVFQNENIKNKIYETNIEKYGTKSPIQNEQIKEKSRETCQEKYGVGNPLQNKDIKDKSDATNIERYGVPNPQQNTDIRIKTRQTFDDTVAQNDTGYYTLVNTLRNEGFWKYLEQNSLKDTCGKFNLNYQSTTAALLKEEFKDKYYRTYSFPTQQKQQELFHWISSIGAQVVMNCRDIIHPLELDIFDKNRNIAIEFNGSYWHSEAHLPRNVAKTKHVEKTRLCAKKGIRLIHIFEHTYITQEKQVKNFLRSAFGLNKIKVPARACKMTHDDASTFLKEYHIQGNPSNILKYFNLEYKGEIVGCMTASHHHEKGGDEKSCILSRLAFRDGTTVQGGSSKLFKYFVQWAKENRFESVVSWSDNCISEGGVYKILGFDLKQEYPPSYFYYDSDNHRYMTKQSQRKTNKNRTQGTTIVDWNNSRGMYVIWDCGKKKWVYSLSKKNICTNHDILAIVDKVKSNLSFDLIQDKYLGPTPIHGACYITSEAVYHLIKDKYPLQVKRHKMQDVTHWWLETGNEIIDPTAEQFDFEYPYHLGKNSAFLTVVPSKRCEILLTRIRDKSSCTSIV